MLRDAINTMKQKQVFLEVTKALLLTTIKVSLLLGAVSSAGFVIPQLRQMKINNKSLLIQVDLFN